MDLNCIINLSNFTFLENNETKGNDTVGTNDRGCSVLQIILPSVIVPAIIIIIIITVIVLVVLWRRRRKSDSYSK